MTSELIPQKKLSPIDSGGFSIGEPLRVETLRRVNQQMSLYTFLVNSRKPRYVELANTQKGYYRVSEAKERNTEFDLIDMHSAIRILDFDMADLSLTQKFSLLVYTVWSTNEDENIANEEGGKTPAINAKEKTARMFEITTSALEEFLDIGDNVETRSFEYFDILDIARKMRKTRRAHGMLEANAGLLKHVKDVIVKPATDGMTWDQIARLIPERYTKDAPNTSAKGDRVRLAVLNLIELGEIFPEKKDRVMLRKRVQKEVIRVYQNAHADERITIEALLEELQAQDIPTSERTLRKLLQEMREEEQRKKPKAPLFEQEAG